MRRPILWILSLSFAAALAAIAATPPNLTKAIEAQRKLTFEHPQDAGAFNDLGNLYLLVHRPAEAEEAYRRAVELDPQRVPALFNLGLLLVEKNQRKEAFDLLAKVVELEPNNAWAHYNLGALHEGAGRKDRAVREYAQAFALDPQLALADVNPHVIDSKLTTEAMLSAYRGGYGPPTAPKQWADPSRIADMLIPPPAEKKDEMPGEAEPAMAQPAPPGAPAVAAPPVAPSVPGGSRVLTEGTLDRGSSVGQATQPGVARPGLQRQPVPRQPGVRTWTRPDPSTVPDEEEQGVLDDQGGEVYTPPSPTGGFIYQPGLPSTGRLDVKVVPDRVASYASPARPGVRGRR